MQWLVVAIIGLVGTVIASSAFTELFKRRDLRESIKSDIEIWNQLPDESSARADLLRHIDDRVLRIGAEPESGRTGDILLVTTLFVAVVGATVTRIVQGGNDMGFRRDDEGVLRYYRSSGGSYTFGTFVLISTMFVLFLLIYAFVVIKLRPWLNRRLSAMLQRKTAERDAAQDETPTQTASLPSGSTLPPVQADG